jgi:ankyrin repeat protein
MSMRNATNTVVKQVPQIIEGVRLMKVGIGKRGTGQIERGEDDESTRKQKVQGSEEKIETGLIPHDQSQRTYLHEAAGAGNAVDVQKQIGAGAEVDAKDRNGYTPLMLAVQGHADSVKILIDFGADVNAVANDSMTPLHVAMRDCDSKILKLLLNAGADVNQTDNMKNTPLHVAAMNGFRQPVMFTEANPKDRDLPQYGIAAEMLIKFGAEVNNQNWLRNTPLTIAAICDSVHVAKVLIFALQCQNLSLDADEKDGNLKKSPLLLAIEHFRRRYSPTTDLTVAMLLIRAGANVDVVDEKGCTPLHWAAARGMTTVVTALLQRQKSRTKHLDLEGSMRKMIKWNINDCNEWGQTPLHWAAIHGQYASAELLLKEGARVNAKDMDGRTPLNAVASHCMKFTNRHRNEAKQEKRHLVPLVRVLISYNAEINAQDNKGNTPMSIAEERQNETLVNLLREARSDQHPGRH